MSLFLERAEATHSSWVLDYSQSRRSQTIIRSAFSLGQASMRLLLQSEQNAERRFVFHFFLFFFGSFSNVGLRYYHNCLKAALSALGHKLSYTNSSAGGAGAGVEILGLLRALSGTITFSFHCVYGGLKNTEESSFSKYSPCPL